MKPLKVGKVYAEHHDRTVKYLRSRYRLTEEELEDLSHEVYLRLLRIGDDELAAAATSSYLYKMAMNVAAEWATRAYQKRRYSVDIQEFDEFIESHMRPVESPLQALSRDDAKREVNRIVNTLTPRQQLCIRAHIDDELTYKEIADKHGMTYRMVLRFLTQAYSQLRLRLDPELLEVLSAETLLFQGSRTQAQEHDD